jgi:hypothetical protein
MRKGQLPPKKQSKREKDNSLQSNGANEKKTDPSKATEQKRKRHIDTSSSLIGISFLPHLDEHCQPTFTTD